MFGTMLCIIDMTIMLWFFFHQERMHWSESSYIYVVTPIFCGYITEIFLLSMSSLTETLQGY